MKRLWVARRTVVDGLAVLELGGGQQQVAERLVVDLSKAQTEHGLGLAQRMRVAHAVRWEYSDKTCATRGRTRRRDEMIRMPWDNGTSR